MKIFISWSGKKSQQAATVLRSWLPDVIQNIEPWMSSEDIGAGSRWSREIEQQLQETNFGIICLTHNNSIAPWVNFEAGAIAKSVNNSFVCPFLLDITSSQIPRGPLNLFQSKIADKKGTWELLQSINSAMPNGSLNEQQLERTFERWWPDLEAALKSLPNDDTDEEVNEASQEKVLGEILDTIRSISRKMQRGDMERDIIRAAKEIKFITPLIPKQPKLFNINIDNSYEKLMREKVGDMSFDELEKLYKVVLEHQKEKENVESQCYNQTNE